MHKYEDSTPEKWHKVTSKTVFEHPRLTLVEDDVLLPDDKTIKYLRHENKGNGGVIVICIKDDKILVQQEYSYPVDEVLHQFPGGRIEEGETHMEAAKRECIEESGLIPEELEYLGWFYPDNRLTNAKLHVVLARNFTKTKKRGGDDEEFIASNFMPITELRQKIRDGHITNYAMLAAWALLTAKYKSTGSAKIINGASKITIINEEYFGKDKSRNYLKHDFRRAVEGFVQREVLGTVLIECSKNHHNKKEYRNEAGEVIGVDIGDYDPDNAGLLHTISNNHELGVMIDLRLLLNKNENGAGGKFIKDLTRLKVEDFFEYYKNGKKNGVSIPRLLLGQLMKDLASGVQQNGAEFLESHKDKIQEKADELVAKAEKFNSRNYSDIIVKDYEAAKFHKDRQPEKYEVTESTEDFGLMAFDTVTRLDRSKVEVNEICDALNDFAEIIALYQLLVNENTGSDGLNVPLDTYVERTFKLFHKDISNNSRQKVVNNLAKYLHGALSIMAWGITSSDDA